ncbi:MAG TPA: hypothetical protein VHP37_00345 [Burkholderiales bacterium]|nr:hypothetical protein [Burkholderiales bacterium]
MKRREALLSLAAAGAAVAWPRPAAAQQHPREKLVALVRARSNVDPKTRPIQKIEPVELTPEPGNTVDNLPVFDHFVGDLHLRYVFDDERFVQAVRGRDLKRLKLDRKALPALVVENYRKLYPDLSVIQPYAGMGAVIKGGQLEPTILLDADFWDEQEKRIGAALIVAAPQRDMVVFTRFEPKQNIELLKHRAVLAYEQAGERALSRTILAWRQKRWEVVA